MGYIRPTKVSSVAAFFLNMGVSVGFFYGEPTCKSAGGTVA
jgi:hypothetical protein